MKKSRYTEEQVAFALKQAELGTPVAEVCRKMGVSEATFFRWKQKYGGLGPSELRKLRQLEEENTKLKRLVADISLDKSMLQAEPPDGFIAEFGGSRGEEAPAKQVELSAAIHGPLQQLETVDLPLGLAAAPGQAECGADRCPVLVEAGREALNDPLTAAARFRQPCAEGRDGGGASALGPAAAADDVAEPAAEVHDLGRLVVLQNARDLCGGFGIAVVRLAQRVPRQLLRRRQRRG